MSAEGLRFGPAAFYDPKRTPEFRRFYHPLISSYTTEPAWVDLHSDDAVGRHIPRASPDTALTAFCQLAVMKLGVKRAMIFLFDADYGYILAEATKSTSFKPNLQSAGEDGLWLGHTKIPRGFSVCEHTVNLPANTGTNQESPSATVAHIINDLTGDVRFCNRPYVTSGPLCRYYAGVPITTPNGANIGAFCALDDKPRHETTDDEIQTLVDLSAAIMSHLEATRAKIESQSHTVRLNSLLSFLEDTRILREADSESLMSQAADPLARRGSGLGVPAPAPIESSVSNASHTSPQMEANISDAKNNNTSLKEPSNPSSSRMDLSKLKSPEEIALSVYQHAALVLQKALNVDSVVFFDAEAPASDAAANISKELNRVVCTLSSGHDTVNEDRPASMSRDQQFASEPGEDETCAVLGAALASSESTFTLRRRQLKNLAYRFDAGKIWSVTQDESSSTDETNKDLNAADDETANTRPQRRRKHEGTTRFLRSLARSGSGIFFPIWSHGSNKLFAGVFILTSSPNRVFSLDGELHFVRLFCDVIVAVLGRLDLQFTTQAKSTFVASVSHELRTPLHGILGTVELLQNMTLDPETSTLMSQIETCGQTMLDIINHILDFSHVTQIVQQRTSSSDEVKSNQSTARLAKVLLSGPQATKWTRGKKSLDRITEDVISSVIYSHYLNPSQQAQVTTILDIDQGPNVNWNTNFSVGAWKRICTNIVVNALKYTSEGSIHIKLKQNLPVGDADPTALLLVTDTGRGMSENFMKNSLFRPFEQENLLSPGSGLGLSLVAKIVKAVRGRISVESTLNVGTVVSVTIPLPRSRKRTVAFASDVRLQGEGENEHAATTLVPHFLGSSWSSDDAVFGKTRLLLQSALSKSIAQAVGQMNLATFLHSSIHLNVICETDLEWFNALLQSPMPTSDADSSPDSCNYPLIVVCKSVLGVRQAKTVVDSFTWDLLRKVAYITEPFGPLQISRSISAWFEEKKTSPPAVRSMSEESIDAPQTRPRLPRTISSSKTRPVNKVEATSTANVDDALPLSSPEPPPSTSDMLQDPSPNLDRSSAPIETKLPSTSHPTTVRVDALPVPQSTLPLRPPPPATPSNPPLATTPAGLRKPPSTNLVMLLVDDNDINLRLLTMYADQKRHARHLAMNGMEAWKLYEAALVAKLSPDRSITKQRPLDLDPQPSSTPTIIVPNDLPATPISELPPPTTLPASPIPWPQVILMDINMPIMDGCEATRRIRALEAKLASPFRAYIIALTGLGAEQSQREAFASGMDLYLTKPVRLKDLTRILAEKFPFLK